MSGGGGGGGDRPLFGRRRAEALLIKSCFLWDKTPKGSRNFIPFYVEYYFSEADKKILSNK